MERVESGVRRTGQGGAGIMKPSFRYIPHDQLDKKRWDETLGRCVNAMPYAQSYFLDTVCPGWNALVYGDYEALFPFPTGKKAWIGYSFTPPFVQQLGLFSPINPTSSQTDDVLRLCTEHALWIDLKMNHGHQQLSDAIVQRWNRNLVLDLSPSYDEVRKKYSTNLTRNIKKGKKNNIRISTGNDIKPVIALFRSDRGKNIDGMDDRAYDLLARLYDKALAHGQSQLLLAATEDGKTIAGAFFLKWKDRHVLMFTGNSTEGKTLGAMPFLIDHHISQNAGQQGCLLDFEGSNDDNLARFYGSFGAEEERYATIRINHLPWWARIWKG
ncbi:MAG: GNAT family N-acetyltransferase [Flavobacteriales bacterium]|nr:GNAT family N-acetyltransferase [Flavobacteriales bacterium]